MVIGPRDVARLLRQLLTRSQVQILPPLLREALETGAVGYSFRIDTTQALGFITSTVAAHGGGL